MNTITATQLRTKTRKLIEALLDGKEVSLIHRSKVIGVFKPKKSAKTFDAKKFMEITNHLNHPILTDAEIDKRYRAAMIKKHGKYLSRHKRLL